MAALLHLGALGDLIVALPAMALLRRHAGPLSLWGPRAAGGLLLETGSVDVARDASALACAPLFTGSPAPLAGLVADGEPALVLLHEDGLAAQAFRRAGARTLVAAPRPAEGDPVHVTDHLLRSAATLLGIEAPAAVAPALATTPGSQAAAESMLGSHGLDGRRVALIHPGSGGASKCWPLAHFLEVAARLRSAGLSSLLVLGPVERERMPHAAAEGRRAGLSVLEDAPLSLVAALAARAAVFIGNDAGTTHLAAAAGAPTVALFGASDPVQWAPRGSAGTRTLDARPDFRGLTPAAVARAALEAAR